MLNRLEVSEARDLPTSRLAGTSDALTIGGLSASRLSATGEMQLPKVSFIIRNWNYGRFIGRTIDSILAQDYPNFEIVIVDNASTDDSRAVIERHAGDDPRFLVIHSDVNHGPLGGALLGLERATGDFISFVDSDDTLLSNFASVHVQVHLAARQNVAFTSATAIETGPNGAMLNGHRTRLDTDYGQSADGLRPAEVVPRLRMVDDDTYSTLQRNIRMLQPVMMKWPWSPGSSNMYRRFILDMLAPVCDAADLSKLSADGHYNRLAHLLGGSAIIDLPLSTYRIHGSNFAASQPSLAHLGGDAGPATKFHSIRSREIVRVFVANAAEFSRRVGEKRYWNALGSLLELVDFRSAGGVAEWNHDQFFEGQVRHLVSVFGERRTIRRLAAVVPQALLRSGIAALHGPKWPVRAHLDLHLGPTRRMHARIKRALRKRRGKSSSGSH